MEKDDSTNYKDKIEELFEMDGLDYISNPRKVKRGGGAAIIANLRFCTINKLQIIPPKPLEVVWGLAKPKDAGPKYRKTRPRV